MSNGWHRLFIYGTLKSGQPNNDILTDLKNGKATFVCCGRTKAKYPLIIATHANLPTVLFKDEGLGHNIQGEIWDVDDQMMETLDEFEGYPNYYDRARIMVEVDEPAKDANNGTTREETCTMYFIRDYDRQEMLQLKCYSDYDSAGDHGLQYIKENDDDPDFRREPEFT